MIFTWQNTILKAQHQSQQQIFVGIRGIWKKSLADSRLDFTEKSPQRTGVALEFVQSSISAIWSQPSDSDYEHTPNGCFSFMSPCSSVFYSKNNLVCSISHLKRKSDMNHFPWEKKKKKNLFSISYTWVKLSLLVIHTRLIYYIALKRKCSKCIQHIKYLCSAKIDWRALHNWYKCIKPRMNC